MQIHIEVTQDDIDKGCELDKIGADGGCMVWQAFQRCTECSFPFAIVEFDGIYVYGSMADVEADADDFRNSRAQMFISMPPFVEDRIRMFDDGDRVEPFAFDIDLPIEVTV